MSAVSVCASLPTIIMGVMLVNYESTLSADQRRRDTGTLKTRGASGSQAFMWIMTAALFTGLVGSVGAVIVGYLAAALSGTVRTLLEFQFSQLQVFTFAPPLESLAFVFGFSFTVGFIVALPSAVRALTMSATEAHAAIAREDLSVPEMSQTPWADIIALGISAFVLTGIIGVFQLCRRSLNSGLNIVHYGLVPCSFLVQFHAYSIQTGSKCASKGSQLAEETFAISWGKDCQSQPSSVPQNPIPRRRISRDGIHCGPVLGGFCHDRLLSYERPPYVRIRC